MNLFNIDINKVLPNIIDAYSSVYGEEYSDIISKKINSAIVIQYYDLDGYEDYLSYIKRCKRREFAITFLNNIGFNFSDIPFSKQFDEDVSKILDIFLGSEYTCFDSYLDKYFSPICAFDPKNNVDSEKLLENKIKLINYLLSDKKLLITKDNYEYFTKTPEYSRVLKKIVFYYHIYIALQRKYQEFESLLIPYQEFINNEKEKQKIHFESKRSELFNIVFPLVSDDVKLTLKSLDLQEQIDILLGTRDLSLKTPLEYFSQNDMNKLYSNDVSIDEKYWIIFFQSAYLKSLGISFDGDYIISRESEEYVKKYLEFLKTDSVKKCIPSQETIEIIENARDDKYNEALFEYYTERDDFKSNYSFFVDNATNKNFLFQQILSNDICIIECGGRNANNDFISLMFFTFKKNFGGKLMHCFVHELGHIIDQNENGCGFETSTYQCNPSEKNQYDETHRKYEKFNETLNDIYALEVLDILQNKGTYLIEDKSITSDDTSSFNTSIYVKQLLYPLIEKYRYYVSKSKIYANPNYLIEAIGLKNYEDLIDIVNKVTSLVDNGLYSKSNHSIELEKEYFEQLDLLDEVYSNINDYHNCVKHILIK